jgi:hypothetical protein
MRAPHRAEAEKGLVRLRCAENLLSEMAKNQKPPCGTQARTFVGRPCGSHAFRSLRLATPSSAGNARDRRHKERRKPRTLTEQFYIHTSCYPRRSLKPQFLSVNSAPIATFRLTVSSGIFLAPEGLPKNVGQRFKLVARQPASRLILATESYASLVLWCPPRCGIKAGVVSV